MTFRAHDTATAGSPPARFETGGIADIPAVAELARISFDPHYREAWTAAQMAAVLASPGGFLLLLRGANGGLASFALCRQVLDEVELLLCATHPDLRRCGIGGRTIDAVIATCLERGARRLFLEVRASNIAARALYTASGMQQQGVRKSYYRTVTGDSIDAITLGLVLSQ